VSNALNDVWTNTTADSGFEDSVTPPPGVYIARVPRTNAGKSKKGELYFAVDLKNDDHSWVIYKQLTNGGQPVDGKIKSAKITLRQLGLEVPSPDQLPAALKTIEGGYYSVEVKASDKINPVTGEPYYNTEVLGKASAPSQPAAPAGASVFPSAVPGQPPTVVAPTQAADANTPPW
jgi:hypothetical protein